MSTFNSRSRSAVSTPQLGSPGFRRVAMLGALCAAFSITPIVAGAGIANASPLVPCNYGPVGSRLEVDCENRDYTPGTVRISAWCTNAAWIGWEERMAPQSRTHITRDCGPGAHPIVWFVSGKSDWERIQEELNDDD
ncbi:hypothetical protein ACFXNW_11005 [Nocardia sp. NPDC059180]|uniref:hypothetical protein n=1 Tax=Nocardia sp. NPDC059180 TaxID=3346761 RepID=UPI0036932ACA